MLGPMRAWLAVPFGLYLVLCAGCYSPTEACNDFETKWEAIYSRCGIIADVRVVFPDGSPATCEDVNRIRDLDEFCDECFVWLDHVTCDQAATFTHGITDLNPTCQDQLIFEM